MTTRRDITWRQGALLSELLTTDVDLTGRSLRCHVRRRKSDSTIMLAFESAGPADQRITAEAEGVRITLGAVAGETVQTGGRDQPWVYDVEAVLDADPEDVLRLFEGAWIVSADVTRDGTQTAPMPDGDLRYLRDINLEAGTGVTLTPTGTGASRVITIAATGGGGAAVWGGITGTLSAQTDLQSALDGKVGTGDSRLSDARTPTAHKSTHATGGSDALTAADIGAAAASHTHPLSDLQQSSAATRQIAEWSGTAWAPITPPLYIVGTSAISSRIPDNTAAGGNARGNYAIDIQTERSAATQVASGAYSFAAGTLNTVSAVLGVAIGRQNVVSGGGGFARGQNNTVPGEWASANGINNVASGNSSWIPGGQGASTHGIRGAHAWTNATIGGTTGSSQHFGNVFVTTTTDATPTILTATGSSPSSDNVMVLRNKCSWSGIVDVQARDASGNTASWVFKLRAKRGANAASTTIARLITMDSDTTEMPGVACTIVANTTRGSWEVQVTGIAATTIDWIADVTVGSLMHR